MSNNQVYYPSSVHICSQWLFILSSEANITWYGFTRHTLYINYIAIYTHSSYVLYILYIAIYTHSSYVLYIIIYSYLHSQ